VGRGCEAVFHSGNISSNVSTIFRCARTSAWTSFQRMRSRAYVMLWPVTGSIIGRGTRAVRSSPCGLSLVRGLSGCASMPSEGPAGPWLIIVPKPSTTDDTSLTRCTGQAPGNPRVLVPFKRRVPGLNPLACLSAEEELRLVRFGLLPKRFLPARMYATLGGDVFSPSGFLAARGIPSRSGVHHLGFATTRLARSHGSGRPGSDGCGRGRRSQTTLWRWVGPIRGTPRRQRRGVREWIRMQGLGSSHERRVRQEGRRVLG